MQNGAGPRRTSVVVPVPNDRQLRRGSWIEDNRRYVDKVTGGKVGDVYLPDTGIRVELDQMALANGRDAQLDASIGYVMRGTREDPAARPGLAPADPHRAG